MFQMLISQVPAGGFDLSYQAILSQATSLGYTLPSSGQQTKQNDFILDLKASGIWNKLDVLYVFATDGSSDFATLNWKAPGSFQITKTVSPTFASNAGFTGNGSTQFLNTNWIPNTNGVNYLLDNSSIFYWCNTNSTRNETMWGSSAASVTNRAVLNPKNVSSQAQYTINATTITTVANAGTSNGLWHVKRTASNAIAVFKNGVSFTTASTTSTSRPTTSIYICGENANGTLSGASNRQISFWGAGDSLDTYEAALNTDWNTYFTSL